jgi:hypothetical protein
MHGQDVRARQMPGKPEQMRYVHQVAAQAADHFLALNVSAEGVGSKHLDELKVLRQLADFADLFRRAQQKILVVAIEPGQCADNVAGIRTDAELVHPANVDGNLHAVI